MIRRGDESNGAVFSACMRYRYLLWRAWPGEHAQITFIMLNPSTADESNNDPTVERCERRARDMGFTRMVVANIFALRSTDPSVLYRVEDPVGPDNDRMIVSAASVSKAGAAVTTVVCAWGTHGALGARGLAVRGMLVQAGLGPVYHLGLTKDGHPRHPLYIGYKTKPQAWLPPRPAAS